MLSNTEFYWFIVLGNKYTVGGKSIVCFRPKLWFSGKTIACQPFHGSFWTSIL